MAAFEGNGQCREARFYYHDFLTDRGIVPKSVADHIDGCAQCRAQVQRLRQMLGEAVGAGNACRMNHSRGLIAELQSHFEHVGEQVTCSQVRRFLPALLADRIRVPTPITVHVDQCDLCTEDLERLRSLGLTEEQLTRLEGLYAQPVEVDLSLCRQVKLMLVETDDLRLEEIPAHVADHICSCPQCRERVYQARRDLLDRCREHPVADPYVSCSRIMAGDVFDFVVPQGMNVSGRTGAADWRRTTADHVFSCARCLAKVQDMHRAVYGMAERPDSGVATIYSATGVVTAPSRKNRNSYAAYPIDVRVVGGQLKAAGRKSRRVGTLVTSLRRRIHRRGLKRAVPAVALTAAVLVLMGIYVFSSQSASGLNLGQLRREAAKVSSVHITFLDRNGSTLQETWVSDSDSVRVFSVEHPGRESLVRDIRNRLRIPVSPSWSPIQRTVLNGREYQEAKAAIENKLQLDFGKFSAKAELQYRQESESGDGSALEVYKITSQAKVQGDISGENYLLLYLNPTTGLPGRIESYSTSPLSGQSELTRTRWYEYPTDAEVLEHFKGIITRP
jgi:hypothetical protein